MWSFGTFAETWTATTAFEDSVKTGITGISQWGAQRSPQSPGSSRKSAVFLLSCLSCSVCVFLGYLWMCVCVSVCVCVYTRAFLSCVMLNALWLEGDDRSASPPAPGIPNPKWAEPLIPVCSTWQRSVYQCWLMYCRAGVVTDSGSSKVIQCHQEDIEPVSNGARCGRACVGFRSTKTAGDIAVNGVGVP